MKVLSLSQTGASAESSSGRLPKSSLVVPIWRRTLQMEALWVDRFASMLKLFLGLARFVEHHPSLDSQSSVGRGMHRIVHPAEKGPEGIGSPRASLQNNWLS